MQDVAKAKVPVMFIIDEAYAVMKGGFPIIDDNYAQAREFGIKFWFLYQDLAQATMLYGEQGFETFINNAGVFQSFATQDLLTSEYVSRRTGTNTEYEYSTSGSRTFGPQASISSGASLKQTPRPLMLPQEIREMDDGMTVAFSHKWKGTALSYLPYPTELPHMRDIMRLDPAD